jgi:hypothetical protein
LSNAVHYYPFIMPEFPTDEVFGQHKHFSSNNSSDFTVVAVFKTPEAAAKAAKEVERILMAIQAWYSTREDEAKELWAESPTPPTPVEAETGKRLGFQWPGAIEWFNNGKVSIVLDRLVYISPSGFRPAQ